MGAELLGVDLDTVVASAAALAEIKALALEQQVLFLPDQDVPATTFAALAREFGTELPHPAYPRVAGAPTVQILESTEQRPSKIERWHTDMTFSRVPPDWTLLHGQIIPAYGGDTLWSSALAAYDALSQPMKRLLEPLNAVHDFSHGFRESLAEAGGRERLAGAIAENPPVSHPVIRVHPETGRRALFVNPLFTTHIEGVTAAESEALLAFLYQHQVTEEFTVRLHWAPGTLAIWDNRSTLHKPVNDFFPQHRRLHRVTIAGRSEPRGVSSAI